MGVGIEKRDMPLEGLILNPAPTAEELSRRDKLLAKKNRGQRLTPDEIEEFKRITRKDAFHRFDTGDLDETTLLLRLSYVNYAWDPAKLTRGPTIELDPKDWKCQ